jgi:hypothetical protein
MKSVTFTIILFTTLVIPAFTQEPPTPLERLYSAHMSDVHYGLDQVEFLHFQDAIPIIHDNYERYDLFTKFRSVITLHSLNDPDFPGIADYFITNLPPDNEQFRSVVYLLMFIGSENGAFKDGYLYFDTNPNDTYYYIFVNALGKALSTIPYDVYARNKFIEIMQTHSEKYLRLDALVYLYGKYGAEINPHIKNLYLSHSDVDVRLNCAEYLIMVKDTETREWIYQNIFNEPSSTIKNVFANEYLIEYFGEPKDLKLINDLLAIEQKPLYVELYQITRNQFVPPQFDISLQPHEIADIIASHIIDIHDFKWCPREYIDYFIPINEAVVANKPSLAIELIVQLLDQVEHDYQSELITLEGYKFLLYEPQYLKGVLEER